MPTSQNDFTRRLRNAFGCFASGVTVVTMRDDSGVPTGITVNSFSSLSLDPALVMFSIGCNQISCRWFEAGEYFTVNVLAHGQEHIAWQFARPVEDKFDGISAKVGANNIPVIDGAVAHFACRKWRIMEGGDHMIIVGEVTEFHSNDDDALLFYRGAMRRIAE